MEEGEAPDFKPRTGLCHPSSADRGVMEAPHSSHTKHLLPDPPPGWPRKQTAAEEVQRTQNTQGAQGGGPRGPGSSWEAM